MTSNAIHADRSSDNAAADAVTLQVHSESLPAWVSVVNDLSIWHHKGLYVRTVRGARSCDCVH
jgi:hypothetical protein